MLWFRISSTKIRKIALSFYWSTFRQIGQILGLIKNLKKIKKFGRKSDDDGFSYVRHSEIVPKSFECLTFSENVWNRSEIVPKSFECLTFSEIVYVRHSKIIDFHWFFIDIYSHFSSKSLIFIDFQKSNTLFNRSPWISTFKKIQAHHMKIDETCYPPPDAF